MDEKRVERLVQLRRSIDKNLRLHGPGGKRSCIGSQFYLYNLFQYCDQEARDRERNLSPEERILFLELLRK